MGDPLAGILDLRSGSSLVAAVFMTVTFGARIRLSVCRVFRSAERRLWMNAYVVMMACASLHLRWSGFRPRWRARQRRCWQHCWPTRPFAAA